MRRVPLIIEPDPDDPDFATVMVDATIAGRPYRLLLDTGAARTQLRTDAYTSALRPVGEGMSSASFGSSVTEPVVTVSDLAIGPLRLATLDVARTERGLGQVLGMDVLSRYRCHFRLASPWVEDRGAEC
ncbi:MAG TPA: retropepsin-like aspartic protease [Streptosporangiaceae bacterium]|nr:retropepsin-like aspartic protease [Streptosporangiaceae bacterium]